ncbi:hypothetical protein J2X67_005476 [Variovorax sp. 3319]|nr:hypothetical protein [Variovorax sp. 3319]
MLVAAHGAHAAGQMNQPAERARAGQNLRRLWREREDERIEPGPSRASGEAGSLFAFGNSGGRPRPFSISTSPAISMVLLTRSSKTPDRRSSPSLNGVSRHRDEKERGIGESPAQRPCHTFVIWAGQFQVKDRRIGPQRCAGRHGVLPGVDPLCRSRAHRCWPGRAVWSQLQAIAMKFVAAFRARNRRLRTLPCAQ